MSKNIRKSISFYILAILIFNLYTKNIFSLESQIAQDIQAREPRETEDIAKNITCREKILKIIDPKSIAKALTYRATGTIFTIVVSYLLTKNISDSLIIGASDLVGKLIIYYIHERVWNQCKCSCWNKETDSDS